MSGNNRIGPSWFPCSSRQITLWCLLISLLTWTTSCADGRSGGRFRDRMEARRAPPVEGLTKQTIDVDSTQRTYYLHVPPGKPAGPVPLVLVFHGGRGNGSGAAAMSGFNAVADRHGFVVAYPESTGNWRDGRSTTGSGFEDIEFVRAIINRLEQTENVYRKRVYSTGISNGGIFTLRLACDAAQEIAAFAPVAASMPVPFKPECKPARPVPIMLIHGMEDEWVRFEGGEVRSGRDAGAGGKVISVPETLEFWRQANGCSAEGQEIQMLDPEDDGTSVEIASYRGCESGSELSFVKINGGGHTWPGSPRPPRRMATRLVGLTSQDISASETIWAFFKDKQLP